MFNTGQDETHAYYSLIPGTITQYSITGDKDAVVQLGMTFTPTLDVTEMLAIIPTPLNVGDFGVGSNGNDIPQYQPSTPDGNSFFKVPAGKTDSPDTSTDYIGIATVDNGNINKLVMSETGELKVFVQAGEGTDWKQLFTDDQANNKFVPVTRKISGHDLTTDINLTNKDVGLDKVTNDAQLKISSNLADLTDPQAARKNLQLGSMAVQQAASVAITGGTATLDTLTVSGKSSLNGGYIGTEYAIVLDNTTSDLNTLLFNKKDGGERQLYICNTDGAGTNITNKPTNVKGSFNLVVERVRYASDTDNLTKQTLSSQNGERVWYRFGGNKSGATIPTWNDWKLITVSDDLGTMAKQNADAVNITGGTIVVDKTTTNTLGVSNAATIANLTARGNTMNVQPDTGGTTVGVQIGSTTQLVQSYIDFNTSGLNVNYDSRIIASGGTATDGNGILSLIGREIRLNGDVILSTPLGINSGGTGANNATNARTNLGVYSTSQTDNKVRDIAIPSTTGGDNYYLVATLKDSQSGSGFVQFRVNGANNYGAPVSTWDYVSLSARGIANGLNTTNGDSFFTHMRMMRDKSSAPLELGYAIQADKSVNIYLRSQSYWQGTRIQVDAIDNGGTFILGVLATYDGSSQEWVKTVPTGYTPIVPKNMITERDSPAFTNKDNNFSTKQSFNADIVINPGSDANSILTLGQSTIRDNGTKALIISSNSGTTTGSQGIFFRPNGDTDSSIQYNVNSQGHYFVGATNFNGLVSLGSLNSSGTATFNMYSGKRIAIDLTNTTRDLNTLIFSGTDSGNENLFVCRNSGGSANITNMPPGVDGNFTLRVESMRQNIATDATSKQTLACSTTNKTYVRYGRITTSGNVWSVWAELLDSESDYTLNGVITFGGATNFDNTATFKQNITTNGIINAAGGINSTKYATFSGSTTVFNSTAQFGGGINCYSSFNCTEPGTFARILYVKNTITNPQQYNNGGTYQLKMEGRGGWAGGDASGAYCNLFLEENTGTEHYLAIRLNGFGSDRQWRFRSGGQTTSPLGDLQVAGSDRRLKEDIVPISTDDAVNALDRINQVKISEFKFKSIDRVQRGWIAQDLDAIPGAKYAYLGGTTTDDIGTEFQVMNVDINAIIADLILVVQKLSQEINELKSKYNEGE
ncbi:TPA: tail fiber domain-containing protein [Klebsiella aerogenes]